MYKQKLNYSTCLAFLEEVGLLQTRKVTVRYLPTIGLPLLNGYQIPNLSVGRDTEKIF